MKSDPPLTLPTAILLDMDGTVTCPMLDFDAIRAEMGIGRSAILEAMAVMSDQRRDECQQILARHEEHAAENSSLNDGCDRLIDTLRRLDIPTALITRNSLRSVQTVLNKHGLAFGCVISRETCKPKPHPEPLHHACSSLRSSPADTWMIGDGQYDVEAGLAAGMRTVWVSHGKQKTFAATPWREARDLDAVIALLESCVRQDKGVSR